MLKRLSSNTLRVVNESCDGRTTRYDSGECNGLITIEKKLRPLKQLDVILVALGTNDVKTKYGPPDAVEVVGGIDQIIRVIRRGSHGTSVALLTPPPIGTVNCGDLAGAQRRIPVLAAECRRYAFNRGVRFVDLFSVIDVDEDLEADHIHLNASGRRKTADAVWRSIRDWYPFPSTSTDR